MQSTAHHMAPYCFYYTIYQSSLHLKPMLKPWHPCTITHHHRRCHWCCDARKSTLIRCSVGLPETRMIFMPWVNASSFPNQNFSHCAAASELVWAWICVRIFSSEFNFTYQMDKTSIEKEQHHRTISQMMATCTGSNISTHTHKYMPGKEMWKNEERMHLSHEHVTIFISLLGICFFSFLCLVTLPSKCSRLEVCDAFHNCDYFPHVLLFLFSIFFLNLPGAAYNRMGKEWADNKKIPYANVA